MVIANCYEVSLAATETTSSVVMDSAYTGREAHVSEVWDAP